MANPKLKKPNSVRLALIQTSASGSPEANLAKAVSAIGQAVKGGAQIICLQELFRSPYFCLTEDQKYFKLAEKIPGP
ncbi:MAG: acyltransferase, partial [Candidatus Omnitrophica bacterium]|nr:acyltransferase [Candidatus Omnitrophota bacterium]